MNHHKDLRRCCAAALFLLLLTFQQLPVFANKATLNVLFDELGQQIQVEMYTGNRLSGPGSLFSTINDAGWTYSVGNITSETLCGGVDVLVLTNRVSQGYSTDELSTIFSFVKGGGGLWCLSNHGPPHFDHLLNNHVSYDSAVATTFLTTYQPAAYRNKVNSNEEVHLLGMNLANHPIIQGKVGWPIARNSSDLQVTEIVTRSFCGVYQNSFTSLVVGLQDLDGVVKNDQDNGPITDNVAWAVAVDHNVVGDGRVVIGADAGWLGNTDSYIPGWGEFQKGDNAQYALNSLAWLGQLDLNSSHAGGLANDGSMKICLLADDSKENKTEPMVAGILLAVVLSVLSILFVLVRRWTMRSHVELGSSDSVGCREEDDRNRDDREIL